MQINEMDLMLEGAAEESLPETAAKGKLKLSRKEMRIFSAGLGRLLSGGIPILRALELIQKQFHRQRVQKIFGDVRQRIQEGENLSEALQSSPFILPHYFIPMIQAGEISGNLDSVLEMLSGYLEREEESIRKIREALAYPVFVLALGFCTIIFILKFVLPRMVSIYSSFGQELPITTKVLLTLGNFAFPIAIVFVALIALAFARKKDFISLVPLKNILKFPFVGGFIQKMLQSRFSSLLALELQSGIQILQAVDSVGSISPLPFFRDDLKQTAESLAQGKPLSECLSETEWMDESALALIAAGEDSGKLVESLFYIGRESERDLESKTQFILKILEPALILGVGLVVGFIVISTILPILEINDLVR